MTWWDDPRARERKRAYNALYYRGGRRPVRRKPALLRMLALLDRDPGEVVVPALGPCWVWQGATNADGYGIMRGDKDPETGKQPLILVHRLALMAHLGRPIREGMLANHRCDYRRCARPAHLYEGTPEENVHDMIDRGRYRGFGVEHRTAIA